MQHEFADHRRMLSVAQLNEYVKAVMDGDPILSSVTVRGEISNFKRYPSSGHLYFTLKDPEGQLRAVMFQSSAVRLRFVPGDGQTVIAHGHVSVYPQRGEYQLYVDTMQQDGAGTLAMRYEQLRKKLEGEGLFDLSRKKPLPPMPRRIGVITSPSGAAIHDIRNILARRFPCAEMILFPSAVQGEEAAEELRLGIEFFGSTGLCDVIIIGRGGGSAEDLWAFNDEALARAIAACPIPTVSAVGHESDFTICDFVADRRAPTPSAAAELCVPDKSELLSALFGTRERMGQLVTGRMDAERRYLNSLSSASVIRQPARIFDGLRLRLSEIEGRIEHTAALAVTRKKGLLAEKGAALEAMSPLSVLSRGYAAVSRGEKTVTKAADVRCGDRLQIRFADGRIEAVAEKEKGVDGYAKESIDL